MNSLNTNPLFKSFFIYKENRYDVEFFEISSDELPDLPWSQVYAVGNFLNKVPIVKYAKAKDNLPGGGVKAGESVDEALRREMLEELNMKVVSWYPLGYQKVTSKKGEVGFQLRVYAELTRNGAFRKDPDGSVIGHELVDIKDVNEHIEYGPIGDWLIDKAKASYGKKS